MIAARFCPPEGPSVCYFCNSWSSRCQRVWRGLISLARCRKCRDGQ